MFYLDDEVRIAHISKTALVPRKTALQSKLLLNKLPPEFQQCNAKSTGDTTQL